MEKTKRIILSDASSINSKGFKVDLSGLNMERFKANPVMLYQHNHDKVIGRWENWSVEDGKLSAEPIFDDGDALGAEIKRKYDNDFLRAASIGLQVYDLQQIDGTLTVTSGELMEASIVSIPADAGAVVLYNDKKEILTLEQVQLHLTNKFNNKNMEIKLSAVTAESLGLTGIITSKDVELAVAEKDKTIAELNLKIKEKENEVFATYLSQMEKDGRISNVEHSEFLTLSQTGGFESVKKIIESRPLTAQTSLAQAVAQTNLTAGREQWSFIDWSKKDPRGLLKLKHENPKQYERLQQELKSL